MGQVSDSFYVAVAEQLGVPPEHIPGAVEFFKVWQQTEGGNAEFNPFNTTYGEPGATSYNSVGVRNYPDQAEGVQATVRTLLDGLPQYGYDPIIYALRDGNFAAAANAVDHSSWGTHGLAENYGRATQQGQPQQASGTPAQGQRPEPARNGHVQALQAFLAARSYAPANSRRTDGSYDGIAGPGTREALAGLIHSGRDNVAALQDFLAQNGATPGNSRRSDGSWDGIYGPGTAAALNSYAGVTV